MNKEVFLIDTNSLITPHLTYYPFDFAPSFWEQMERHIEDGDIAILDIVKSEILQGKDSLKDWILNLHNIGKYIDHRQSAILEQYAAILQYIQNSPYYKPSALKEWAGENIADPWLIATAKVYDYTIITFESLNKGLNAKTPSKNVKIPDVAKEFEVKTQNLYYLMRVLKFKL